MMEANIKTRYSGCELIYNEAFGDVYSLVKRVNYETTAFLEIFEPAYKMMIGKFFGSDFSDEAFVSMLKKMLDDFSIWDDTDSTFVFFEKCIKGYIEQRCGVIDELRYKKIIDDLKPYVERPETLTVTILQEIIPPTTNKPKNVRIVGSKASLADIAAANYSEDNTFSVGDFVIVERSGGRPQEYGTIKKILEEHTYEVGTGTEGKDSKYFAKKVIFDDLQERHPHLFNKWVGRYNLFPLKLLGKLPASIAFKELDMPAEAKASGAHVTAGSAVTGDQLQDALRLLMQKLNDLSRALSKPA